MSDPGTHDAPEQKSDAPRGLDWRGWLLGSVGVAFGLVLTGAWIVFLAWGVAEIV
jgi:hypothetical protein